LNVIVDSVPLAILP